MKLTMIERLLLTNQMLILEKLYPEDGRYYARHRTALQEGYAIHYKDLFQHIESDELSEEACREVLDVLEMCRAITLSARELKVPEDHPIRHNYYFGFQGFDGNNENALMAYTRYFINDLDRYAALRGQGHDDFNSHSPMMGTYRKMLQDWCKSGNKHKLTEADLTRILSVVGHQTDPLPFCRSSRNGPSSSGPCDRHPLHRASSRGGPDRSEDRRWPEDENPG